MFKWIEKLINRNKETISPIYPSLYHKKETSEERIKYSKHIMDSQVCNICERLEKEANKAINPGRTLGRLRQHQAGSKCTRKIVNE